MFVDWINLEAKELVHVPFIVRDCILEAISASSTDNYPEESIDNTLQPAEIVEGRASYWSSKGHSNPEVPERLTYKLADNFCVITEINICPFQGIVSNVSTNYAFFQFVLTL